MERRNFLSGLMAAPLALKARFLALFQKRPVQPCGAPIWRGFRLPCIYELSCNRSLWIRKGEILKLLCAGKIDEEVASRQFSELNEAISRNTDSHPIPVEAPFHCSRPLGHKGPHIQLNTPTARQREIVELLASGSKY